MADFQPDCESAKELYGQLMELNSLEISQRLACFINQYRLALDHQILEDIGKIKVWGHRKWSLEVRPKG